MLRITAVKTDFFTLNLLYGSDYFLKFPCIKPELLINYQNIIYMFYHVNIFFWSGFFFHKRTAKYIDIQQITKVRSPAFRRAVFIRADCLI